jgi:hypothetical protein
VVAAVAGCAGLLAGLAVSTSAALVGAIALALAAGVVVDD